MKASCGSYVPRMTRQGLSVYQRLARLADEMRERRIRRCVKSSVREMVGGVEMLEYLTTHEGVVKMSNRKAIRIVERREEAGPGGFVELNIWKVPEPVPGCTHSYKYRLAYVVDGECVLRYDNERGKGDHRHFVSAETPYEFRSVKQLSADLFLNVQVWNRWRSR